MIDAKKTYTSNNYGDFRIINYMNARNVYIEFIATGYRLMVFADCIKKGTVKDRLMPFVQGVGFMGEGRYSAKHKAYKVWSHMLTRCYCSKYHKIQPSYKSCTVSTVWCDFQEFAKWFDVNYIEGYHLDKDIKIDGNRVYSPDTCIFVKQKDNAIKANAMNYVFISPKGEFVSIFNMREFCLSNGLSAPAMSGVNSGKRKRHKGWTKA